MPPEPRPIASPWRGALARLALAWGILIALQRDDWAAMANQWWNIATYTHVLLVPLIIAWLIYDRWRDLARLTPSPWWPGLGLLAAALALWLAGRLAGTAELSEAGAVAALAACVPLLLGVRVSAGLAFPLFYMVFLVPVGDELVAPLQTITARLTVFLLHTSHVPALLDGIFITTPAGLFKVAEACSGVKFLIAMIAFGALAANLCFIRWWRRAAFMLACLVVPVLANGVRAWATVFIAGFIGADSATGFDHIIYGWVFFALVIAATLGASWRFFDRPAGAALIDAEALLANPWLTRLAGYRCPVWLALAGLVGLALGASAWAEAADRLEASLPATVTLAPVPGWQRVDTPADTPAGARWQPLAEGAGRRVLAIYQDASGERVDVFVALYAAQGPGRKASGFGEGAAAPGWAWIASGPAVPGALSERLRHGDGITRLAETRYRTGDDGGADCLTGSALVLRLCSLRDKVLLHRRVTMLLILSAEDHADAPAERTLARFRQATGPMAAWMARLGQGDASTNLMHPIATPSR